MKPLIIISIISLIVATSAKAQLFGSATIEPESPLRYPLSDTLLRGVSPLGPLYGYELEAGCLVQLIAATNGAVAEAAFDGSPGDGNVLWLETEIGAGVSPRPEHKGRFSIVLSEPPAGTFFIRVFNAPALEMSTRYAQSDLFSMSVDGHMPIPMRWEDEAYASDTDGDGVNDVWETLNGTNPSIMDSDGDGFQDGDEFRAGTNPRDPASHLAILGVSAGLSATTVVWDAVTGKYYRVDAAPGPSLMAALFARSGGLIQATNHVMSASIDIAGDTNAAIRVRLVD